MEKLQQLSPAQFRKRLLELHSVFLSVAIGDFSVELDMPEEEDEFAELHCGVKLMLDSMKEKIAELNELNDRLNELTKKQAVALNEVENLARVGSWELDVVKNKIQFSDELYRIYGIDPDLNLNISYEYYLSLIHPEDRDFVNEIIQNAAAHKTCWSFFHRIIDLNGRTKILHGKGRIEEDNRGRITRIYGTAQDVTEMKLAEQELQQSRKELRKRVNERTKELEEAYMNLQYEMEENKKAQLKQSELAAIVESSSEAIIGKSLDGIITSWSKGAEKIYGYKSEEIIGEHISIIYPDNKKKELTRLLNEVKASGKVEHYETVRLKKDGTPVHLDLTLSLIRSDEGKITGVASFGIDITEEIKMRKKFEASEIKYKTLVRTMNEGVIVVDNKDEIRFVNPAFCKLIGHEMTELVGKPAMNYLTVEGAAGKEKYLAGIKNKSKDQFEIEIKKKNGDSVWVLISRAPLFLHDNELQGYVNLITDINLRKKYENELDSVAKFSSENPNPTLRYSINEQKFIFYNTASKHLIKFIGAKSNKETGIQFIQLINKVNEKGKIAREEVTISNHTYLFTVVPVKAGNYVNLYGSDITATKKAEAEIKRLIFVLSQTDNAVMIAGKEGKIQWVNEGFEKLTGYKLKEIKATHGEKLRHGKPTGLNPENLYFRKMISLKQSVSYESKNYKKDGTEYWAFTTLTPALDANGEVDGIVAVDADISEKKKVEKQMFLAMQMSEESAKAKQNFLANMSHEIRTPMNVIMGIIQLLKDTPLDKEQSEYLNSMDFAGENLMSIVNDVLDISKIESGKMIIEKLDFNLRDLINELINSMGYRAREKSLGLNVEYSKSVPLLIAGDPVRLNQILINLLSNSIKFTSEGEIKLSIDAEKAGNNIVNVKFTVTDTGIGIPAEKQEMIFQEFEQAHSGNKRKFGGTGLGLSIVKKLVKIQNGQIHLESTPGKGSSFIIIIPYEVAGSSSIKKVKERDAEQDPYILNGKEILLVEDNKLNQMVAEKFLKSMGISVEIAGNGLEAVRSLKEKNFDAVLMDIQMPEMDGYETTRYIRQNMNDHKQNIPILAMTAHALIGEEKKCFDAGMDDYITKPLRKEMLERILTKLFYKNETGY